MVLNVWVDDGRFTPIEYRRAGNSGLDLPIMALGLWHNFGESKDFDTQRAVVRRAFELGITHFDLANNYGPPPGSAETNFGRVLNSDLRSHRDEVVIASKAGYRMWDGPYGDGGSRKYLLASLDQSLERLGIEYVDIFYHHRFDPTTPLEETAGALATAVNSGRALYVGVSNYTGRQVRHMRSLLAEWHVPLLVQQERFSMFDRRIESSTPDEPSVLAVAADVGVGLTVFSPLAQGLLTERYLAGRVPGDSRAAVNHFLPRTNITKEYLAIARGLNDLANGRGQTLAQLAVAWVLRHQEVTSALIGASSVAQLEQTVGAAGNLNLSPEELAQIDTILGGYSI
jgi:L-glyceraldehyde 3-phosphate reductase